MRYFEVFTEVPSNIILIAEVYLLFVVPSEQPQTLPGYRREQVFQPTPLTLYDVIFPHPFGQPADIEPGVIFEY